MDFRLVYSAQSVVDKQNREILNEIDEKRKAASEFDIKCKTEDGRLGIWFDYGDAHILISPTDLFNSIFCVEDRIWADGYLEGSPDKIPFHIDVRREPYIYTWSILSPELKMLTRRFFMQDEYIRVISRVLNELNAKIDAGEEWAYDFLDAKVEALKMSLQQFDVKEAFPTYYTRFVTDIRKEEFVFKPIDAERYTIGIGDRQYSTVLTHWDSDYDYIRHSLEEYHYNRKATIELPFDNSDTIIELELVNIMDCAERQDNGVKFSYRPFMRVEIHSNQFAGMPVIVGYCDVEQTLRTLYEGLLKLALNHSREGDEYGDEPGCIVAYNQFKSPIIESAIRQDSCEGKISYLNRQVCVKDVLTIVPDCDVFIMCLNGVYIGWENLDDLCGKQVHIEGLKEWCEEIEPIVIDAAVGKPYQKDWKDFHDRGLVLAKQLRKVLPKEYDLWYDAPFEDKSGIIAKPVLIF